jgi:hypothetical protein
VRNTVGADSTEHYLCWNRCKERGAGETESDSVFSAE